MVCLRFIKISYKLEVIFSLKDWKFLLCRINSIVNEYDNLKCIPGIFLVCELLAPLGAASKKYGGHYSWKI